MIKNVVSIKIYNTLYIHTGKEFPLRAHVTPRNGDASRYTSEGLVSSPHYFYPIHGQALTEFILVFGGLCESWCRSRFSACYLLFCNVGVGEGRRCVRLGRAARSQRHLKISDGYSENYIRERAFFFPQPTTELVLFIYLFSLFENVDCFRL